MEPKFKMLRSQAQQLLFVLLLAILFIWPMLEIVEQSAASKDNLYKWVKTIDPAILIKFQG